MDLSEAIAGRRAVREYTVAPVDERTIRLLIADAVQAPSAINEQPWTFTVVRDQALLDRASRQAKAHMLATTPQSALPTHFKTMLDDASFQIFYHAPVLVLISAATKGAWSVEDCALAAQNLMLAAYAAGLGSCWIGFAQSYLNTPDGRAALRLPDAWTAIAPIILGHPKTVTKVVPRKTPEIHWVD
jgi:nitroreductase